MSDDERTNAHTHGDHEADDAWGREESSMTRSGVVRHSEGGSRKKKGVFFKLLKQSVS